MLGKCRGDKLLKGQSKLPWSFEVTGHGSSQSRGIPNTLSPHPLLYKDHVIFHYLEMKYTANITTLIHNFLRNRCNCLTVIQKRERTCVVK